MQYFDLHCDTITECTIKGVPLSSNQLHIDLARARKYSPWVQFFAVWTPDDLRGADAWKRFTQVYDNFLREIRLNAQTTAFCGNAAEIDEAVQARKNVALLSIEGAACLCGRIDRLEEVWRRGVRMVTLTWNGKCETGDGCMVERDSGLSDFGREVVRRMDALGIVADVSHLSQKGFWDLAKETGKPFIASHSNSAAACPHRRNLKDDQFAEIVRRGGLVGLNFYPNFITGVGQANLMDLLRHIDHFLSLGGEDIIAIGSDFDGASMPDGVGGVQDMEKFYYILEHNYGPVITGKIFYGNAYRFFHTALKDCGACNRAAYGIQ